ncbi:MAG: LUD domain-containing protein [Planctomycetes bacterium]|nr:LUD domain-containing protein [Planctomycetota bacterium]
MTTPTHTSQARHLGTDREVFLAKIRGALGAKKGRTITEPVPDVDESLVRLCQTDEDLPARFADRAQALGMQIHHAKVNELGAQIGNILEKHNCKEAVTSIAHQLLNKQVTEILRDLGTAMIDHKSTSWHDQQFDVDAGITDVDAALAETGSIIISSGAHRSRGSYLAPPLHIALVRTSQILADLIDYFDCKNDWLDEPNQSATVLISGPSKTADIEGILITGVHGPGMVHIIIIDDQSQSE